MEKKMKFKISKKRTLGIGIRKLYAKSHGPRAFGYRVMMYQSRLYISVVTTTTDMSWTPKWPFSKCCKNGTKSNFDMRLTAP